MRKLILLFFVLLLASCAEKSEEQSQRISFFDPGFPGTKTDSSLNLRPVMNLKAESEKLGEVKLNWEMPAVYDGLDWVAYVFRVDGGFYQQNEFRLPDPSDPLEAAYLFLASADFEPFKGTEYVDRRVLEGDEYTYIVHIRLEERWSAEARTFALSKSVSGSVEVPSAGDFWDRAQLGSSLGINKPEATSGSLSAGASAPGETKGKMAWGAEGSILYVAETERNRVSVFANQAYFQCKRQHEDPDDLAACIDMNKDAPLQFMSVLGQPDFASSYSCHDDQNPLGDDECMSGPSALLARGDRLYVATADGRVMVYAGLPYYGCHNINSITGPTVKQCKASKIFGRKGFSDFSAYSLASDGDKALFCPSGMAMDAGDLYISEGCKNRVVVVKNATNDALSSCSEETWGTSQCRFAGVLGQKDLFSSDSFSLAMSPGPGGEPARLEYSLHEDKLSDGGDFLRRHFANPTTLEFDDQGRLLVLADENFSRPMAGVELKLRSRILAWSESPLKGSLPECRPQTFEEGGCDADFVIGQRGFDRIPALAAGEEYLDLDYALLGSDFSLAGRHLFFAGADSGRIMYWSDFTRMETEQHNGVRADFPIERPDPTRAGGDGTYLLPDVERIKTLSFIPSKGQLMIHIDQRAEHGDWNYGKVYPVPLQSEGQ